MDQFKINENNFNDIYKILHSLDNSKGRKKFKQLDN